MHYAALSARDLFPALCPPHPASRPSNTHAFPPPFQPRSRTLTYRLSWATPPPTTATPPTAASLMRYAEKRKRNHRAGKCSLVGSEGLQKVGRGGGGPRLSCLAVGGGGGAAGGGGYASCSADAKSPPLSPTENPYEESQHSSNRRPPLRTPPHLLFSPPPPSFSRRSRSRSRA